MIEPEDPRRVNHDPIIEVMMEIAPMASGCINTASSFGKRCYNFCHSFGGGVLSINERSHERQPVWRVEYLSCVACRNHCYGAIGRHHGILYFNKIFSCQNYRASLNNRAWN